MPIDRETFEERSDFESGETHATRILHFLAANDEQAFRRGEIAEATEIDPNAVSAVLSRLKERGLVRHKPPYWAIGDEQRLVTATDLRRSLDSWRERLEREDIEEWRDAGANRSQPSDDGTNAE